MRVETKATLAVLLLAARGGVAQEEVAQPPAAQSELAEPEVASVEETYEPLLSTDLEGRTLELRFSMAERVAAGSSFPIDRYGNVFDPDPAFNTQIRIGGLVNTGRSLAPARLLLVYEHDLWTGTHAGGFEAEEAFGVDYPTTDDAASELRKLYAQIDYTEAFHLRGGIQTSYWGLGLVANDGDHGWEPGNAQFIDPRNGDIVLRGLAAVGPFTDADLFVALGVDSVRHDDVLLPGDQANQLVAAVTLGFDSPNRIGMYGVVRRQEAEDGSTLEAQAIDLAGAIEVDLGEGHTLTAEGEAAYIWGTTELSPTTDYPIHDVRQFGATARVMADLGQFGGVLDLLYATGDADPDDGVVSSFKSDPNYSMGLLLFPVVLSAQTARAPATASDRELIGVPAEDLERFPTRGSATNTIAFFPKVFWRPVRGLEAYGGALLALSEVPLVDPFNTRLAGGEPRNALNGVPGSYLGTELDLGLAYRGLFAGTELTVAVEGGMFLPGSAFRTPEGGTMQSVTGGRAIVRYRF